jgi:hypothetical protein
MTSLPLYEVRIVPALRRIQEQYGYLKREAVEQFAREADVPLHRIQAVASFFPHFRNAQPPDVTVRVCRDMACHMNGSAKTMAAVARACGGKAHVEGASCLGRCDRPPATCVEIAGAGGHGHELYLLGRTPEQIAEFAATCVAAAAGNGAIPDGDVDLDSRYDAAQWEIDPYGKPSPAGTAPPKAYAAVQAIAGARITAIEKAATLLRQKGEWSRDRAELFIVAAQRRLIVEFPVDDELRDAVRDFQTNDGWAKGPRPATGPSRSWPSWTTPTPISRHGRRGHPGDSRNGATSATPSAPPVAAGRTIAASSSSTATRASRARSRTASCCSARRT